MTIPVRSLNDVGLAKFSAWLDNPTTPAPKTLLEDDSASEFVDGGHLIDPSLQFQTSYEAGRYLSHEVFSGNPDRFSLLSNHGLWAWISLVLIDSLVKKGSGKDAGKPLAKPHYIMDSPRLAYRLITRTAWDLVNLHGDAAKVALGSSRSPWGEMAEQMTARQEIYAHRSFWPVANALYAAPDGSVKKGVTSQRSRQARSDPKSKAGLGGIRRLPFTFKQFERTYNLRRMTGDEITSLLPPEYQRWRRD
ncbi:hypothetical protein [Luteimonas terrae]|uniref:Uncharacterized protein n=1 Tax=Luteimonas terrae TaxID=1530191 RepID=A0A4R5U8B5_9GAMM|nr:hypothetical protein [Luteimonas terrae]TDK30716.1 hypothetical protein E2F49_10210 [Luteimonas terrae]